jgi:hypothetical protein
MPDIRRHLRSIIASVVIALGSSALGTAAFAGANCSEFFSNSDGSWSPTHPIVLASPTSQAIIGPSDRFRAGVPGMSGRIGRYLDVRCRPSRAAVGVRAIPRTP